MIDTRDKMDILKLLFVAAFSAFAVVGNGQSSHSCVSVDSLAFAKADWTVTDLGKGAQARCAQISMFNSMQSVCLVKYPLRKFRTDILHRPGAAAGKASEIGKETCASFVVNGGFFHVKKSIPAVYFREGKNQLGYTHPTELYRVDGVVGFTDRKGRNLMIKPISDTTMYGVVSEGWREVIASGPVLIIGGDIVVPDQVGNKSDGRSVKFYDRRHPRTVLGRDDEGNAYLVVIDGRFKGEADGATIYETAYICRLLGMTDAINLDGGGSSTLWTQKTGVVNHPSDNRIFDHQGERSVPNLIRVY